MTSTPVGMRCPECARERTPVKTIATLSDAPTVTYALIGLNVLVYLAVMLSGASPTGGGFGGSSLVEAWAVGRTGVGDGELWRLVSAGFLHAQFFHLLLNMIALYVLGGQLEPAIGRVRFALVYFVSLLAGSFGALLLTSTGLTLGASGAVFGLMAAAAIVMHSRGISLMESGIGVWIALNLVFTFAIPGISIGGHLGGLVGGALVALILFHGRAKAGIPAAAATALVVGIGLAAVGGSLLVSAS